MRCNKKNFCSLFIKDKNVLIFPIIVVVFAYEIPPVGDLAANPFLLSLKNPTEWRARLPLGGLAAVQYSPKCLKILPSGEPASDSEA